MTDQTPAEMREAAKRLREIAHGTPEYAVAEFEELEAGADALDRLADVIEYAEWVTYGCADPLVRWENPEPAFEVGASVIRIARGETNEEEKR